MTANLKLIKTTHRPVVDVYAKWREEIEQRDWARVHVSGDKNPPLEIGDGPKRGWR